MPRQATRARFGHRRTPAGTTTKRGYGSPHRALRTMLLAAWRPGDPCSRCGLPMWGPASEIHLGHDDEDRTRYRGLEHRACNLKAAQRKGGAVSTRMQRSRRRTPRTTGRW